MRARRRTTGLPATVAFAAWSILAASTACAQDAAPAAPDAALTAWAVIVHPDNPVRSMKREELERIYRRRTRDWPHGRAILPLNLPSGDPLRRAFTEDILHDDEETLATFWNREYFQGTAPPVVLRSSKAVRAYVATTPAAIGYVRREDLDASVVEVEVAGGD